MIHYDSDFLRAFVVQHINTIKEKNYFLYFFSEPIWYFERSYSELFLTSLSALSLTLISLLSLFECITHSS